MQSNFDVLAARYGVSVSAVAVLASALQATGGNQAQFNHPELGGMGQWMPGMIMIGDMFNNALKTRVDGLARELAGMLAANPMTLGTDEPISRETAAWWSPGLGTPDSSGSENDLRYAYFSSHNRLFIKTHGHITVYDATGYRIIGVSQQQTDGVQMIMLHTAT